MSRSTLLVSAVVLVGSVAAFVVGTRAGRALDRQGRSVTVAPQPHSTPAPPSLAKR